MAITNADSISLKASREEKMPFTHYFLQSLMDCDWVQNPSLNHLTSPKACDCCRLPCIQLSGFPVGVGIESHKVKEE